MAEENLATVLNKAEERLFSFEDLPEDEKFARIGEIEEDRRRVQEYNVGKLAKVGEDEVNEYLNRALSLVEQYQD